ncbi:MAG TPA: hypothetical protein VGN51_08410 [Acidimicrobiia bacterium]|jgi:hypothetical protein
MTGQVPFRFCTVASASHYPGLVALVNSLRLVGHREPVTVFDLGLTDRQRAEVGTECEVVAPDGDALHPWLVMPQVLQAVPPGVTVYVDSDIIVTASLEAIAERARAGDVCAFADRFAERRFSEWQDLLGLASAPRVQPYANAGFMALDTARFPEFVQRWRELCDAMVSRSISVAKLDVGDPLTWPDQDALNALLMSEVPPEQVAVQPAEHAAQGPWELSKTRVVDVRTLACTRAGQPVKLLHAFGVPKPWQPEARTSLPRSAYLMCLRRLLTGDDVAIRTTEPPAPWLAPGVRGTTALHLATATTALRARTKRR